MTSDHTQLIDFIVKAKQHTYAAEAGQAQRPLLNDSQQLEYRSGDYFYRDIYFGSLFFAGQETVKFKNSVLWSMTYSGGLASANADSELTNSVYAFLRQALLLVNKKTIYRGPKEFESGQYRFQNESTGDLSQFYGREIILLHQQKVYELHYSGGLIR